jgi:hypothetical protein
MTKATIPTDSNRVTRFFDSLEACLGIPRLMISDGSRAFVSTDLDRLMSTLCESAYDQAQAPNPAKHIRSGD